MVWFWISFVLHKFVLVSPLSLTLISSMAPEGKLIFSCFLYPDCFPGRKKVLISLGVQLTPTAFQVLTVISGEAAEPGAQNLVIHTVFLRDHCAASCTKPLNSSFPSSHTEVIFTQLCKAHLRTMNEGMKGGVHIQNNTLFICSIQNREENGFVVCGLKNLPAVMMITIWKTNLLYA